MQREAEQKLLEWKESSNRMPLIVRGARQVGKTYLIEAFGATHFDCCVTINFELDSQLKPIFSERHPTRILELLEAALNIPIRPGSTLLFLDEIQECPEALAALRYFKERLPELHVIAAGSLLEFVLQDANYRMPVGRVQFFYLRPCSFAEFLTATGHDRLANHLKEWTPANPPHQVLHEELLRHVGRYCAVGGMPAVAQHYADQGSPLACQDMQSDLLAGYQRDFGKYARYTQHKYLQLLFERAPALIARHFRYSKVDPEERSRNLKLALEQLTYAGLVTPVRASSAVGLPLTATENSRKFKLLFLDVGLVTRAARFDLREVLEEDVLRIDQGAIAEQFVGQELLTRRLREELPLFFWERDRKGSAAEVDYLTVVDGQIIPIEVKAGTATRLHSLRIFLEERKLPLGVRLWSGPLQRENHTLSVPLYMTAELDRLIRAC